MNRRRRILIAASVLLITAAVICGGIMRRALDGAADPDTQEIAVAEVMSVVSERISALGDDASKASIQHAVTDQLPVLGARGFIRVHAIGTGIDVLAGTDYGLENADLWSTKTSWAYRMSLSPKSEPDRIQPLFISSATSRMGSTQVRLTVGSAGPTTAQTRASDTYMAVMWSCVCCAAVLLIIVLFPSGSRTRHMGPFWTPVRRGLALALVGALIAAPTSWVLVHRTRTAARISLARGTDLVAATSASTLAGMQPATRLSAAWLHAVHSMEYVDASFRVLVDGKLLNSAGTDYGPGAYVKTGAAGEWRALSPIVGDGAVRPVYVTGATKGGIRVEMAVAEPEYWQVIRLRMILLGVIPAVLTALYALGYATGRRHAERTMLSPEEVLQRAVARQTVFTVLIVCLALVPAAGWFIQTYEAASLGRLDQILQRDAAGLQTTFASMEPETVAAKAVQYADQLDTAQTGLIFSMKSSETAAEGARVSISLNPQYNLLSVVIGANRPHSWVVANHTDPSLPLGHNMFVRAMTFSNQLKDGTVYTALLGTTTRLVRQDMQELWKSALWAGPVAFLFIVLASLAAALLAQRPVRESMRRLEQFTGDAGHELRTPLGSIRLNAQVALAQDQQPEEFHRHLTAVLSQADRSTRLAESLVLLARLDHLDTAPLESVRLSDVWSDLSAAFADQLNAKELTLQTPAGEATVAASRDLLTVALDNLLENAIRYSPQQGTITLTAQETGDWMRISVADQGPGIPQEELPHIWDRFYRVDKSRSRDTGGNGLGLAIARKAVEAMQGHVAVESEIGKGSTFSLLLGVKR